MKHIRYYINVMIFSISFIPLLFISCDKLLEEDPQNKLKPSTVSDFDELLNRAYPQASDYLGYAPLDYYVEMMADDMNLDFYLPTQLPYPYIPFSFADTHEDTGMLGGYDQAWKYHYQSIYYANMVLENIDEADGSADDINYVKGEALALRAFSYFKLINLYALPYHAQSANTDPGVPLKLDGVVQSDSYTRQSVQEVYDQINEDLTRAITLMEGSSRQVESKFKLTPLAANLLASRVFLYQKDYEKTIDYATKVIDRRPNVLNLSGNRYETAMTWGYGGGIRTHAFADESENVLFKYGSNEFYQYVYYPGALGLSGELIAIFEPGDIRLFYSSYIQGAGRRYNKYQPFANRTSEPIRGFRTEEAYLNRAEANAELGQLSEALNDINILRKNKFDAAFNPQDNNYFMWYLDNFEGQEEVVTSIRIERRRELCMEFHRWYDLRRYGMPAITHRYGNETFELKEKDPRYVLQIPQRELDYNPKMEPNPR